MSPADLQSFIMESIPLANHMGLEVLNCSKESVEVKANFYLNRNHKNTAFGGSVNAILTLACSWFSISLRVQLMAR